MQKLLIVTGQPCSIDYYRTLGFWPYFVDTEWMVYEDVNWYNLPQYDAVLVARPVGVNGLRACQIVKELGIRLIVDYDDDMFHLPEGFPARQGDVTEIVKSCLSLADLCICSTPVVEAQYKEFCETIVRRNVHNDWLFRFNPVVSENESFGFRGTPRVHDWNVRRFAKVFRDGEWIFWGGGMEEFYGKHIKELPFMDYMISIRKRSPAVIVKPLIDIPHNRAKSNCTWIEAVYSGSVCLAPDWEEWRHPGIINYYDVDDCKVKLDKLKNKEYRLEMFEKSVEAMSEFLISNVAFHPEDYGLQV